MSYGKYKVRGSIYFIVGLLGILYETLFKHSPETIVIILYVAIIGIGVVSITKLKEHKDPN
ncbi:hypothetical protein IIC38_04100 [candidate division KSB1 bacterium]|nr:hypothetical protein [candidate division KSB1 bacterium]